MISIPVSRLRVVGYEGSLSPHQTPARQLPLFADAEDRDVRYRVVSWRGDDVVVEPVRDGDFTLVDERAPIASAFFVVLGAQERKYRRLLDEALRSCELEPLEWAEPLTHLYLAPADAERVWDAIRDVSSERVCRAAQGGAEREELEELGWWLYAAAMDAAEVALAGRALERAGLQDAKEIAFDGFRRLDGVRRLERADAERVWRETTLPSPVGGSALARPRDRIRQRATVSRNTRRNWRLAA
ncbi:MAG: hypothetical protein KF901_30540 [Myxococcales bacterium]|nr:hypothetical protein [Myxococcales bacterium]